MKAGMDQQPFLNQKLTIQWAKMATVPVGSGECYYCGEGGHW